jgi:hypothetical protein
MAALSPAPLARKPAPTCPHPAPTAPPHPVLVAVTGVCARQRDENAGGGG